ncbi:unnamed protein product [Orchesella dallaii]|uniref:Large ribosomal subunit protein eL6 n=1 Tax=Orchesella dallaii TaxID=48710 RepID=A0ABP1RL31_9HEXA
MPTKKPRAGHKNPLLVPGVHRFGRSTMYHKRGMFIKRNLKTVQKTTAKKPVFVEKPLGGAQNGQKRLVQVKKSKRYHPTAVGKIRRIVQRPSVIKRNRLRGTLKPGTVLILLAGRHAGKRVILLRQLESGLLLVTGPFKLNGIPLRRVNQQYVIATSTRLDLSKVKVPENLNDTYFRRDKKALRKQRQQQEGEIFASVKGGYTLSETRKKDQGEVDKQILSLVKSNPEKKLLLRYLSASFSLRSGQYPHRMKF